MGGCVGNESKVKIPTPSRIIQQLMKFKLKAQINQPRRQKDLDVKQNEFIQKINEKSRSKNLESLLISRLAYQKNIITIYNILITETKNILDYKDSIRNGNITQIMPSLKVLLYSTSVVKDEHLTNLKQMVESTFTSYKQPTDQQIKYKLIVHHKHSEQTTFQMQNTFILNFCNKYQISVDRINQIGHQYKYSSGTVSYV